MVCALDEGHTTMFTSIPFPSLQSVVFLDRYGLTRLTLPHKVKSVVESVSPYPGAMKADGDDAFVIEGTTPSGTSRTRRLAVADLKALKTYPHLDVRGRAFSDAGERVHLLDDAAEADGTGYLFYGVIPADEVNERALVQRSRRYLPPLKYPFSAPDLDLGGTTRSLPVLSHVWPDGRFAHVVHHTTASGILCGDIRAKALSLRWWKPLRHGCDPKRVALHVEGDDLWFAGHEPEHKKAVVARIAAEGDVTTWRYDAIEAPVVRAGIVGLCTAPGALERRYLADPARVETVTFSRELLDHEPATPMKVTSYLPPPAPDDAAGGQVMLLGAALLYVPWHGATVLNPEAAKPAERVIDRKLPAQK